MSPASQLNWESLSSLAAIAVIAIAVVKWALRPLWDSVVMQALKRCNAQLRTYLCEDILLLQIRAVDKAERDAAEAVRRANAAEDNVRFVRDAVMRQGEQLAELPRLSDAQDRTSEALDKMAATLERLRQEQERGGKHLANIDGYLKAGGTFKTREA